MADELSLLIELCKAYDGMGNGLKTRLASVLNGDRLDNHPDIALREMGNWLQLIVPFLNEPIMVNNVVDEIEMYLFGTYLGENGYG